MADNGPSSNSQLDWSNVGLGLTFIVFDAVLSRILDLGVGRSLVVASIRCVLQLAFVATLLSKVFATNNIWAVAGIAVLLNLMGTIETAVVKCKRRFQGMFGYVFISLLCATIPISIIGAQFAMGIRPFWRPDQYIPVIGMLCGSTISGVIVAVSYVLKELEYVPPQQDFEWSLTHISALILAFGASRLEAVKPIAKEALRLALTPVVNQMSVLGIIAIPGMMTGAILGGSSVQQAARLQMVIMFMISASAALASIAITLFTLMVVVDSEHRIRSERIDKHDHFVWRARDRAISRVMRGVKGLVLKMRTNARAKELEGYEAISIPSRR